MSHADEELDAPAEGLDPARVSAALESCGCFVIRNAMPLETIEAIEARVLDGYAALDAGHRAGTLSPEVERRCHSYGILRPFEDDLPLGNGQPMRTAMEALVRQPLLTEIIRRYLGERVTQLMEACHVRRQGPDQIGRPVPPHQDASVMRMQAGRLLNFWVPLTDGAGQTAPGLEFYPKSLDAIVNCSRRGAAGELRQRMYSNFEIDEAAIREAVGDVEPWSPVLNRGDVICLDGWSIHRTAFKPSMARMRYNFEMRFCRTDDLTPAMPGETRAFPLDRQAA